MNDEPAVAEVLSKILYFGAIHNEKLKKSNRARQDTQRQIKLPARIVI